MNKKYISLQEASKGTPYSQEYLSLLARKGKLFSIKLGRNWYTTREAIDGYLKKQSVTIAIPKNLLKQKQIVASLTQSFTPEEPEEGELGLAFGEKGTGHEKHSKMFEEFERLNPRIFNQTKTEEKKTALKETYNKITQPQQQTQQSGPQLNPPVVQQILPSEHLELDNSILNKLDKLSDLVRQELTTSLGVFAEKITAKVSELPETDSGISAKDKEFLKLESSSLGYRFRRFNKYTNSLIRTPVRMTAVMIAAIVTLFLAAGGFSFGQADYVVQQIKKAFKDADTLQGYFPGTHANEVLVLDRAGNISIFGHIETQGQLRSYAPTGVAPIVVDSITKVENLNADYIDDLDSKDFTLAFVTKNGNITYEDVFLEGNVEVGKTLTVKGAAKLLSSLQVYGTLGVFSEAFFSKDINLTGGNLVLEKGTIKISNTSLIKNLNAEFLDGLRKGDITLDFVTDNGASTTNGISVGALDVNGNVDIGGSFKVGGQSDFYGMGFFHAGVWGKDGMFGTLGVAGDATIGNKDKSSNSNFQVYSKKFIVDEIGNITASGKIKTVDLAVSGTVQSDLIPSGSFNLGSSTNKWQKVFAVTAAIDNLVVSGSANFSGTSSSSFRINTDNVSSDSESAYLSFERGTTTPNATLKWNSTNKRFEFNEPLFIASSSLTTFSVSGGPSSLSNTLYVQNSGNVGIGTTAPSSKLEVLGRATATNLEVQGTASASYLLTGNTLQVGGFASVAYSRFGTVATTHTLSATNDLLINGKLEVDGSAYFDGTVNFSGISSASLFYAQSGTATSPSFSFNIDQDTGMFRRAINALGFSTLGAERMTIDSTGNVGIGTTAPLTKFEVQGTASASNLLTVGSLQVANAGATVSYSRFGTGATGHSLTATDDVLFTGLAEFDDNAFFDAKASISSNLQISGRFIADTAASHSFAGDLTISKEFVSSGTASNSFAGSLLISKGLNAQAIVGTALTINGNANITGNTILGDSTGDTVTSNADAWTFANDTNFTLSGGVNGLSFDTNTLSIDATNDRVGIRTTAPSTTFEVQGTASASYLLTGNTLQVGGFASVAYSRFGTTATTHSNFITTTNDVLVNGDFEVDASAAFDGHVAIGDATDGTDLVYINSQVKSNFIPFTNAFNIGSTTNRWQTGFFDKVDATEFSGASVSFGGTNNETFTINADNATADTENSQFVFERGDPTTNAQFQWDATNKRFNLNFPVFVQTADPSETANNFTKLTLKGAADQVSNDYFEIQNSGGSRLLLVEQGGRLIASGSAQFGGASVASTSYSRFGTSTTGHSNYISASNDLLISGDLETRGTASFGGVASVSGNFFTYGTNTFSGTGSSSFVGSLDISKGLRVGANTALTVNANATANTLVLVGGNVGIGTTAPLSKLEVLGRATTTNLEVQGTASASYLLTGNTLQVGGFASAAYSRFGTVATTHGLSATNDLLINGALEVDGSAYFDGTVNFNGISSSSFFYAGNGTAASPSFSFRADQDTGMFRSVVNALGFSTLGAERITIDSTGNVGIGTTAPGAKLHISHDSSAQSLAIGINSNSIADEIQVGTLDFKAGTAGTVIGRITGMSEGTNETGGHLTFETRADSGSLTEKMRIEGAGNVGIGTTAPAEKLHVVGTAILTADTASDLTIKTSKFGSQARTNSQVPFYTLLSSAEASDNIVFLGGGASDGQAATILKFFTAAGINTAQGTERMRIDSAGNVGIGTTAPGAKLDVVSDAIFREGLQVAGTATASYSRFGTSTTGHSNYISSANDLLISGDLETRGTASFGGVASVSGNFFTYGTNTFSGTGSSSFSGSLDISKGLRAGANTALNVNANASANTLVLVGGNVGIGTASPVAKINIAGDMQFTFQSSTNRTINIASNGINDPVNLILNGSDGTNDDGNVILATIGKVGIGTTTPTSLLTVQGRGEFQGTASASYLLIGNTLQVGGFASVAYSRFGTSTTGHSNYISASNDLLISGDLEVDGSISAQFASTSQLFTMNNTASASHFFKSNGSGGTNQSQFSIGVGIGTERLDIFNNNNSPMFTIASSGNVGIGTTSPNPLGIASSIYGKVVTIAQTTSNARALLELWSNVAPANNQIIGQVSFLSGTAPADGPAAVILSNSNGTTANTGDLQFWTSETGGITTKRMTIAHAGNVGIGTTSPDSLLELSSGISNFIIRSTTAAASASIDFQPAGGASNSNQGKFTIRAGGLASTLGERLEFLNGNMTSLMTIASSGNVGIGTTSPASKLNVFTTTPAANDASVRISAPHSQLMFVDTDNSTFGHLSFSNSDWAFRTDSSTATPILWLDGSTKVGINTIAPSSMLTVQGRGEFQGTASASYLLTGNTLQVGGFASAAYSRFGTATLTANPAGNWITGSNDLLISGDLYGVGSIAFAGPASISNTLFVGTGGKTGNVGIGDTTPDQVLELSGATAPKFALSDTGLAHGVTSLAQTDTFLQLEQVTDNDGGGRVLGFSDSVGQDPLRLVGVFGNTNPTDTVPAVWVIGAKSNGGVGSAVLADSETLFGISNNGATNYAVVLGSGNVGIGTTSPTALLHGVGTQPADVATTPGTAGTAVFTVTGATGGDTTIATTGVGGAGALITLTGGVGGGANSATTLSTGGAGGLMTIRSGIGGASTVSSSNGKTGGNGGANNITTGAGGASTGAGTGTNTGGNGGLISITGGTGGAANTGTGSLVSGTGGGINIVGGTGGLGTSGTATGGNGGLIQMFGGVAAAMEGAAGGAVSIQGRAGSSTGSGGAGGNLTLVGGAANGDNTVNRAGGNISMTTGISKGTQAGGAWAFTGGDSGDSQTAGTATGGIGGAITYTMGDGGTASLATVAATGGTGGTFTITGGVGGAGSVAGTGTNTGGKGSLFSWIGGTGGAANGVTSGTNTGGAGGAITIRPGTGGAATAGSGSLVGGTGGLLTLQGGTGGAGSTIGTGGGAALVGGTSGISTGTGGDVTISGGLGGASGTGGNLIFRTAATNSLTTRMTIDETGNIGIGTTAPAQTLHVAGTAQISTSVAGTDDRTLCTVAANGKIEFVNGACGTSSRRYKENIKELGYGLEEITKLNPVFFNYIKDSSADSDHSLIDDRTKRRIGFIAEEVQNVIPEVVIWQDGQIEGLDYAFFTSLLTKGIQELNEKVEDRYASLSFRIDDLEDRVASGNSKITVSSGGGLSDLAGAALVKFQNIWAKGDVITEGVKKTYYSVADAFDWEFDLGLMASNWNSREITFASDAGAEISSLFSGSAAQAADESKLDLKQEDNGAYLATYGVDSARGEIVLSGSSEISGGEAKIFFDFSFTSVISGEIPLKVLLTPTTSMQGQLYVANKTPYGFVVKSFNGPGDGKFDWLVIARRKGYEGADLPAGNQKPAGAGIGETTNNSVEPRLSPSDASISNIDTVSSEQSTVQGSIEVKSLPDSVDGTGLAPVDPLVTTQSQNYSPPTVDESYQSEPASSSGSYSEPSPSPIPQATPESSPSPEPLSSPLPSPSPEV